MILVMGKDNTYSAEIEYLPEFGYTLLLESGSNVNKTESLHVNSLDILSFELKNGQLVPTK